MKTPISFPSRVLLLFVLIISACKKNDLVPRSESPVKENTSLVNISLAGRITDLQQEPIQGAILRAGNSTTQSDINGRFSFSAIMVNPGATLVEVYKPGFYRSYKTMAVQPGSDQYLEIGIKPIMQVHQFTGSSGATLQLPDGGGFQFPANALADKITGRVYPGSVTVSAYALHTGQAEFFSGFPGNRGFDLDKKDVFLEPYSMISTDLESDAAQSLEPAAGQQVKLIFPIADKDLGSAPSAISMWHYDNAMGIWIEEGKAIKNGGNYEGQVKHFSLWACALARPLASVQANITNPQGTGLPYMKVQLFDPVIKAPVSTMAQADGNGYIVMPAIAGHELELRVLNDCGESLHSRKVSFQNSTNWLGKITVESAGTGQATIQGKVENCKNSGVYSGEVTLHLEGRIYRAPIQSGRFVLQVPRCSAANAVGSLVATDAAGNQESAVIRVEVGTGNTDIGIISTCNPGNSQYVSYTINGTNYLLQAPTDSIVQAFSAITGKTTIECYRGTDRSKPALTFSFNGQKPGQYPVNALNINQDKLAFAPTGNLAVEITKYGQPGEFITGKCAGQVKSPSFNQALPFSFNFKVLRK